jgi:hypothetical protein
MAVSIGQTAGKGRAANVTSVTPAAFSGQPSSGSTVFVLVWGWSGSNGQPNGCTDNQSPSNTYVRDQVVRDLTNHTFCALYRATNVTVNTAGFLPTVTTDALATIECCAVEVQGLDNASPLDKTHTASGNSANPAPGSVTPAWLNEYVAALHAADVGNTTATITTPTGFTARGTETDNTTWQEGEAADRIITDGSTQNPQWTINPTGPWIALICTYKGAGSAAAGSVRIARHQPNRPPPREPRPVFTW